MILRVFFLTLNIWGVLLVLPAQQLFPLIILARNNSFSIKNSLFNCQGYQSTPNPSPLFPSWTQNPRWWKYFTPTSKVTSLGVGMRQEHGNAGALFAGIGTLALGQRRSLFFSRGPPADKKPVQMEWDSAMGREEERAEEKEREERRERERDISLVTPCEY